MSDISSVAPHFHSLEIPLSDLELLKAGEKLRVVTSTTAGHDHEVDLVYEKKTTKSGKIQEVGKCCYLMHHRFVQSSQSNNWATATCLTTRCHCQLSQPVVSTLTCFISSPLGLVGCPYNLVYIALHAWYIQNYMYATFS